MNAPKTITAGFDVEWDESLAEYSAETYGLSATLILTSSGATRITVAATANGTDFSFSIPASSTANYTAGDYKLYLYATLGSSKYLIGTQDVEIKANPLTATGDQRSHTRKVLDAIDAVLENRATQEYASMSINGYSITQLSPAELLKLKDHYEAKLKQEQNAEGMAAGKPSKRNILVQLS